MIGFFVIVTLIFAVAVTVVCIFLIVHIEKKPVDLEPLEPSTPTGAKAADGW